MAIDSRIIPSGELSYRHHAIIDRMLAYPHLSKKDIAEQMGYTVAYMYQITKTDAFQVEYDKRRLEYQEGVALSLGTRLVEQAHRSMDVVEQELKRTIINEDSGEEMLAADPRFALDAQHRALQAIGLVGKNGSPAVQVNVNQTNQVATGSVPREQFIAAREKMKLVRGVVDEPAKASEG